MSNQSRISNINYSRYSQFSLFQKYNNKNTISDVNNFIESASKARNNLYLGRTGYGGSSWQPTYGESASIEWPIPLISLKDLRCSNQNQRFQNPELVPIPRLINRRAFGNYVVVPVDESKSFPQLFTTSGITPYLLPKQPLTPVEAGSLTPFRKAFNAPLLKCGTDSLTTDISLLGFLIAWSISNGRMPNVLPAEVPPCTTLLRLFNLLNFFIAVVTIKSLI